MSNNSALNESIIEEAALAVFSEMDYAIFKYQNRAIETAAVIEELIQLAKEMR